MAQDRPYRAGLPPDEILAFMRRLVSEGRIEAEILRVAEQDMAGAMAAARAAAT